MKQEAPLTYYPRVGTLADVPAMIEVAARHGEDRRRYGHGIERVLRERYGFSVVVASTDGEEERLAGFLNVVVLRPRFGSRLRRGGEPFSHIVATEEDRFVATDEEVGHGNGGSGVDLLITQYLEDPDLPPKQSERVMGLLVSGFVERYAGNKVRSVLAEASGMENARQAEYGGYVIVATYDEWWARSGRREERPILIESDRAIAIRHHNFHLARLLDYEPPILRLPPAAREVVRCAYLGYSDAQMISELCLTPASLNSRWTRILDIAEAKMPSLFAKGKRDRSRDRGPLLAYLRNHPEEMWPYEPAKA